MFKKILPLFLLIGLNVKAQERVQPLQDPPSRPKLVVGIIVDQMRQEYLYRYYDKYGDGGFKRLMREGFNNKNTHFNYIPTKTAPVMPRYIPELHLQYMALLATTGTTGDLKGKWKMWKIR